MKRVAFRITEEEYEILVKASHVTGKSQNQVFKDLLATINLEGVEPVTIQGLQKLANVGDRG